MRRLLFGALVTAALAVPVAAGAPASAFEQQPRVSLVPGDSGQRVHHLQRMLEWMRYDIPDSEQSKDFYGPVTRSVVARFQEKFFITRTGRVNTRTWYRLSEIAGEVGRLPKQCRKGTVACIDIRQKLVRVVEDGKVVKAYDARFGMPGQRTRQGTFAIYWKSRDHWSSGFDAPMPFAMFFSGAQAIHFSPFFKEDGYFGASHGCINIRDREGARWMFDHLSLGTPVHVYTTKPKG